MYESHIIVKDILSEFWALLLVSAEVFNLLFLTFRIFNAMASGNI